MDIKSILKSIKLHESTISMIFGAVLIVISGVLIINFFSKEEGRTIPTPDLKQVITLPTTHEVVKGEDLWSISEKYYDNGHNWVDISKENSLENPGDIKVGQKLIIPDVPTRNPNQLEATSTPFPTETPTSEPIPQIIEDRENMMDENEVYTVQSGDNLWKIAENRFQSGYNWVDIASANGLTNPGLIMTGQELIIPDVSAKESTIIKTEDVSQTHPIVGTSYEIQKGDDLWNIAVRAYGDGYRWVELASVNNIENPGLIFAGNTLIIPR